MGYRTKAISNVPVLVTQDVTVDDIEQTVTFGFGNTTYGIYSPFEGIFALKVEQDIIAPNDYTIQIGSIYGSAKTLYVGDTQVTVAYWSGIGMYLMSFSTVERRLYLTGGTFNGAPVSKPSLMMYNGLKVYLNGVDVTNDQNVQTLDATTQWFGSASQYARLVHDNQVQSGVAYHLYPNPDWDESDEESLSYIKNKPTILDVTIGNTTQSNNKNMILFYK